MNLYQKDLWFLFIASFFLTLVFPTLIPSWKIFFFAPYLISLFYKKSLIISLWGAVGCGLTFDLLSAQHHLGLHAAVFALVSWILYPQKKHFFADSLSTLPLMTFLFSFLTTIFMLPILSLFEQRLAISQAWILKDLILFPALDAFFAFVLWILPFYLFGKPIRKGKDYFLHD